MSSTPLVQQVQTLIAKMEPADRMKIRLLLDHFPGSGRVAGSASSKSNAPKDANDWLLDGILAELGRRGLYYSIRATSAKGVGSLSSSYPLESAHVREQLAKLLKQQVPAYRHQHLLALGKLAAAALADYRPPQAPLGLKYMLNNVGKTFEAIDNSFPGYISSGMLPMMIVNKRTGARR